MASSDLQRRLSQTWPLSLLDQEELQRAAEFFHEETAPTDEVLFRQGEVPTRFYLLESGSIEESGKDSAGNEIVHRRAEMGDYVGGWELLHNKPQRATATVRSDAKLLTIENEDFQTLLAMVPKLRERLDRKNVIGRLLAIPLFASFDSQELANVAQLAREVQYPAGQTIFAEGDEADAFYVIDVGQVEETSKHPTRAGENWPQLLTAGSFFGGHSLLNNTARRATAKATVDTSLFRFSAEAFDWLRRLKPRFDRALARPDVEAYLRATGTFKGLDDTELRRLAGYTGLAYVRPGETLYRQGEVDPTLYILIGGEAIVRERDQDGRERPRSYLKDAGSVGESSLFLQEPRDVTVAATAGSTWCYLTKTDLDRYLKQYPEVKAKLAPKEEIKSRQGMKRLAWMEATEQPVVQTRRHWYFLVSSLLGPFFVLMAALILPIIPNDPDVKTFVTGFSLLMGIVGLLWAAWRFVDWRNDYYFVTNMRVAHQEKTLWIKETFDEALMDKVQNVNLSQGVIGHYLGFGSLVIETAATAGISRVAFTYVPKPAEVQQKILQQTKRLRASEANQSRGLIQEKLEGRIDLGPRLTIPRPAVGVDEAPSASETPQAGIFQRLGEATWKKLLWVERAEADQVIWRKHWLKLLSVIWLPLLSMAIILGLLVLTLASSAGTAPAIVIVLVGLALANLFWLWWSWTNWGNDQYIVTNDRIVDTERLPLGFGSKRTETTFDKIQNVSFNIPGPIATIFSMGTVTIFTAGAQGKLDFVYVKNPQRVQQEIVRRLKAYEEQQHRQQREEQWDLLPEWFAAYDSARRT